MAQHAKRTIGNSVAPPRFLAFMAIYVIAALALVRLRFSASDAIMAGFDIAAAFFLLTVFPLLKDGTPDSIRRHAADNDANRAAVLFIAAAIGVVLLIAIRTEIDGTRDPPALLIIATLALAWLFGNLIYALHYAHLYYREGHRPGGITFPGRDAPDYWDFVYFAFTLGMTFQTSDVTIEGREVRRVVLAQCLVAFVFNIGILAFTINTLGKP